MRESGAWTPMWAWFHRPPAVPVPPEPLRWDICSTDFSPGLWNFLPSLTFCFSSTTERYNSGTSWSIEHAGQRIWNYDPVKVVVLYCITCRFCVCRNRKYHSSTHGRNVGVGGEVGYRCLHKAAWFAKTEFGDFCWSRVCIASTQLFLQLCIYLGGDKVVGGRGQI